MFLSQTIIIDDFYQDPYGIRELAMAMPRMKGSGNYAGSMTSEAFFTDEHRQIFYKITGEEVTAGTSLCGCFRFSRAQDQAKQHIHFDPAAGQVWAGVIYLSLPEHYQHQDDDHNFGTEFWRHNRTGLSTIPMTQLELDRYGWYGVDELKLFLETDGMDSSLWTRTFHVPMAFNRLVLFRPWMFHSPGQWFGESDRDCRLIQTFFLSQPLKGSVA